MTTPGKLYLVATPIGNLKDLTQRAIDTLNEVALICAEDTRHSQPLIQAYGIATPCLSLHAHNESNRCGELLQRLQAGDSIALISDAGTPLISDPGAELVSTLREADIEIVPIPGPCAAITALVASGINSTHFQFMGFLSTKSQKRQQAIESFTQHTCTTILYESVHRINDLMTRLQATLPPDRLVCLARELTKRFEQIITLPIQDLYSWFKNHPECRKGEYVIIISPAKIDPDASNAEATQLLTRLLAELPIKKAVAITADLTSVRKNKLYEQALAILEKHQ